jgi:hypothetical protein
MQAGMTLWVRMPQHLNSIWSGLCGPARAFTLRLSSSGVRAGFMHSSIFFFSLTFASQ